MTGDDHAWANTARSSSSSGSSPSARPAARSPTGSACARPPTSFPGSDFTNAEASTYQSRGFELALHLSTNCQNFTQDSLDDAWVEQLADFAAAWPEPDRAAHEPDALHHVERLGGGAKAEADARRPARHELLLLAGARG